MRLVTLVMCCPLLTAQSPLQFEAASVKLAPAWNGTGMPPIPSFNGGPATPEPTRLAARNLLLNALILRAFDIKPYQLSGPSWLENPDLLRGDMFDIDATIRPETSKEQFRLMLQNLLSERFGLQFHREQKEASGFALVVMKGGHKLQEDNEVIQGVTEKFGPTGPDGFPTTQPGYSGIQPTFNRERLRFKYVRCSIEQLIGGISGNLKRPILDRTELKGHYNFILEYRIPTGAAEAENSAYPDIFGAVQAQLGLKLVAEKVPVEMLIVDHIEKQPSRN